MSDTDNEKPNTEGAEEQPRYYIELVDYILSQLEEFVAGKLEELFKKADEDLFDSAQSASSTAEQNRMFEAMNALRANKQSIQQSFVDELSFYLQPVSELDKLPEKKKSKQPSGGLSLVEQTEMDEMVTLNSMSGKAAGDHREAIDHLIKRLRELAQYNDHIFHGGALEPRILCDAMHESVDKTDLIDKDRLVVYRFFGQTFISKLGELYGSLNNMLIENGILPEIEFSADIPHYEGDYGEEGGGEELDPQAPPPPPVPPGGRRAFGSGIRGYSGYASGAPAGAPGQPPMGGAGAPPSMGGGMPGGQPPMGGGYPGGPAGMGMPAGAPPGQGGAPMQGGGGYGSAAPRRAFGSGMQSFGQGPAAYDPNAPAAAPGAAPAGPETVPTGPSGQATSAGMPVSHVRQSIESFVGGTHSDMVSGGSDNYYSHQQVMTALTDLQEAPEDISQTPLVFDANQIKKAVLSSIGESEGGAVTKAVNQVSEKTIDFIKLIFDAIIDEESITDEIKTLLLSLQIPVIKAAMLDSEFFVDDQHPARQLLDKIAEAGVGVSEHTDPIYIEIEQIVRKLLHDYGEDIVAFKIALDELNTLTEEIYRKARETEARSQKAVKMAHAKGIVLQEIRKITIGRELPLGIRTLVLKVWPSMMFNHYMANGKANDEWVELLMILQKIIESVQPLNSQQELDELGVSYNEILQAARNKLDKCKKNRQTIDQVIQELEDTYDNLMATTDLPDEAELEARAAEEQPAEDETTGMEMPEGEAVSVSEDAEGAEGADEMAISAESAMEVPEEETESTDERDPEVIAREKIAMLPEGVAPGAWFIVYNGEDKPVRRLKLAVILVQDATMVFVDHLGNVVIEKDAEKFADEIDKGLSGVIMQHSVFDHALSSALKSIEH